MPTEIRQKFDHGRRRVLDLNTRLIQNGIDAGELRRLDARTAALAILGIASWTSWWYSPTGRKSPEELAAVLLDVAFNGISLRSKHWFREKCRSCETGRAGHPNLHHAFLPQAAAVMLPIRPCQLFLQR
ncbi:hypothetical protein [Bradyrhizobium erythrophlei]